MTDEMKMWIGLGIFMLLPIAIMAAAWLTDRIDRYVNR
jgi:hypothetical protein